MERLIYTLVRGADWREAERIGEYRGSADDARDGFLPRRCGRAQRSIGVARPISG
jgi:uncharacterized protein (DUF952 family)